VGPCTRKAGLTHHSRSAFRLGLAIVAVALAAPPAIADSSIPGRTAFLARKPKRLAPVAKEVVRAAVRTDKLADNVPRTGLTEVGDAEERLFKDLQKIANSRYLRGSNTAVYVLDARSGEEVYAVREDAPLNPASNVKLIATAAALETLGPDWRYRTRLFGPTPDPDGVAQGDVFLRGNFDPSLRARHMEDLADEIVGAGITRIDGDVIISDKADRDGVASAKLKITVSGTEAGEPPTVTVEPAIGMVDIVNEATSTTRGRSRIKVDRDYVVDPLGRQRVKLTVTGKIRTVTTRKYWRGVKHRALFTAHALLAALERAGIEVTGTARQMSFADYVALAGPSYLPVELAVHRSAPVGRLIARINKKSLNSWADQIVSTAGAAAFGGEPSLDKGVRLMKHWLATRAEVDPDEVLLDTGSGLSYNTQLPAKYVVQVLREATGLRGGLEADRGPDHRLAELYRDSLSIGGRDGTLRRRFRRSAARGHVFGKTGTLIRILALSGIVENERGDALTFAIVTNGHKNGYRYRIRQEHKRMVEAMYRYLRARD
jgi:D-alanyl-D-alanine carboxypeptidase/D-alanyl-D-alanine-endopeptidase (penicillin-binding protein 4)